MSKAKKQNSINLENDKNAREKSNNERWAKASLTSSQLDILAAGKKSKN